MHEVGPICCQAVKEDPQAKCGHLLWYYPFSETILDFLFNVCGSCYFLLFPVYSACSIFDMFFCRHRLAHTNIYRQTHRNIFTCLPEKESINCTVLKPQTTTFSGNAFFWGNWLFFFFLSIFY